MSRWDVVRIAAGGHDDRYLLAGKIVNGDLSCARLAVERGNGEEYCAASGQESRPKMIGFSKPTIRRCQDYWFFRAGRQIQQTGNPIGRCKDDPSRIAPCNS